MLKSKSKLVSVSIIEDIINNDIKSNVFAIETDKHGRINIIVRNPVISELTYLFDNNKYELNKYYHVDSLIDGKIDGDYYHNYDETYYENCVNYTAYIFYKCLYEYIYYNSKFKYYVNIINIFAEHQTYNYALLSLMYLTQNIIFGNIKDIVEKINIAVKYNSFVGHEFLYIFRRMKYIRDNIYYLNTEYKLEYKLDYKHSLKCLLENDNLFKLNDIDSPFKLNAQRMNKICNNFKLANGLDTDSMTITEYLYNVSIIHKSVETIKFIIHNLKPNEIKKKDIIYLQSLTLYNIYIFNNLKCIDELNYIENKNKYKIIKISNYKTIILNYLNEVIDNNSYLNDNIIMNMLIINLSFKRKNKKNNLPEELYKHIYENYFLSNVLTYINDKNYLICNCDSIN